MTRRHRPPQKVDVEYLEEADRKLDLWRDTVRNARTQLLCSSLNLSECGKAAHAKRARALADTLYWLWEDIQKTRVEIDRLARELSK